MQYIANAKDYISCNLETAGHHVFSTFQTTRENLVTLPQQIGHYKDRVVTFLHDGCDEITQILQAIARKAANIFETHKYQLIYAGLTGLQAIMNPREFCIGFAAGVTCYTVFSVLEQTHHVGEARRNIPYLYSYGKESALAQATLLSVKSLSVAAALALNFKHPSSEGTISSLVSGGIAGSITASIVRHIFDTTLHYIS